jgi:hypothetical protein
MPLKVLLVLTVLAALGLAGPAAAQADSMLVGSNTTYSTANAIPANTAEAASFVASATGTSQREYIYIDGSNNTADRWIVGIYADAGGAPGALLAKNSKASYKLNSWNQITLRGVNVTAGTTYWLALLGTGGQLGIRTKSGGCSLASQSGETTLAAAWGGSSAPRGYCPSLYVGGLTGTGAPPLNTLLPSIGGNPYQGQTLTASNGTWIGDTPMSFSYQWQRDGTTKIASATTATYIPQAIDVGHTLTVTVTATNTAGSVPATSAPTAVVQAGGGGGGGGATFPLQVSSNGRYLETAGGQPWLMVGDSPQSLIGDLSVSTAKSFIDDRAAHGFNALWINLLCASYTFCPADGKSYNDSNSTADNLAPFTTGSNPSTYDVSTPNAAYFSRAAQIIAYAQSDGIEVVLDPIEVGGCTGGGWITTIENNGDGTVSTTDKDYKYGQYLGSWATANNLNNIIWMAGNDFYCVGTAADNNDVLSIMNGIKNTNPSALRTMEPKGVPPDKSSDYPSWSTTINLDLAYSYAPSYGEVAAAYAASPTHPAFLGEANYDGEHLQDGCNVPSQSVSAKFCRLQEWWTMTSGATGQLYGSYFTDAIGCGASCQGHSGGTGTIPANGFNAASIDSIPVAELGYETKLLHSIAWQNLVPDTTNTLVTSPAHNATNCPTSGSLSGVPCVTDAWDSTNKNVAVIYDPTGVKFTVNLTQLAAGVSTVARWYDPTNGQYQSAGTFTDTGSQTFTTPGTNSAGDTDWVLLLQAGSFSLDPSFQGASYYAQFSNAFCRFDPSYPSDNCQNFFPVSVWPITSGNWWPGSYARAKQEYVNGVFDGGQNDSEPTFSGAVTNHLWYIVGGPCTWLGSGAGPYAFDNCANQNPSQRLTTPTNWNATVIGYSWPDEPDTNVTNPYLAGSTGCPSPPASQPDACSSLQNANVATSRSGDGTAYGSGTSTRINEENFTKGVFEWAYPPSGWTLAQYDAHLSQLMSPLTMILDDVYGWTDTYEWSQCAQSATQASASSNNFNTSACTANTAGLPTDRTGHAGAWVYGHVIDRIHTLDPHVVKLPISEQLECCGGSFASNDIHGQNSNIITPDMLASATWSILVHGGLGFDEMDYNLQDWISGNRNTAAQNLYPNVGSSWQQNGAMADHTWDGNYAQMQADNMLATTFAPWLNSPTVTGVSATSSLTQSGTVPVTALGKQITVGGQNYLWVIAQADGDATNQMSNLTPTTGTITLPSSVAAGTVYAVYGENRTVTVNASHQIVDTFGTVTRDVPNWMNTSGTVYTNGPLTYGYATHIYYPVAAATYAAAKPTAAFYLPSSDTTNTSSVSGTTVRLAVNAADPVGVASIQFKLDGTNLGSPITLPDSVSVTMGTPTSYAMNWDSTGVVNGAHTLGAVVTDTNGNTANAVNVPITVNNNSASTSPTVTLTASPATSPSPSTGVTLRWASTNANDAAAKCSGEPWTASEATSGSMTVYPQANTTYTVECTDSSARFAVESVVVPVTGGTPWIGSNR